MTAQEQIAKLESLLERIRRNADKPRPMAAVAAHGNARSAALVSPTPAPVITEVAPERMTASVAAAEEVSLDSLGATEAAAPAAAEFPREKVQSADMDELEIVEIGSEIVDISGDGQSAAGDAQVLDEPVPESAPRPAVQSVEVELEPPIKTPPPESGRQAVTPPPPIPEARVPAVASDDDFDEDDLLEADASGGPISIATPGSPTMAQLGDTVHIEGAAASAREIEIAIPPSVAPPVSSGSLEADLPKRDVAAGTYDAALAPPSTASRDLERHREPKHEAPSRRVDPLAATVPDMRTALSLAQTAPDARSPFADAIRATTETTDARPSTAEPAPAVGLAPAATAPEVVVERPSIDAPHTAEVVVAKPRKAAETFVELLDASLELRA